MDCKKWALLAVVLLAGCDARQTKSFNTELTRFVGKNLTEITKRIGYPDVKIEIQGSTVYTWKNDVGDCKLQVTTASDGTITGYHWEGYIKQCKKFTNALDVE